LSSAAPSLIIIGLDGGTFDLMGPWLAAGELPNIAHLLASGSSGILRSTHPPITPVAWSSFLTGCNPGKHGIYAFLELSREDYSPVFLNGGSVALPSFLEMLSKAGLRVGALNIPWTYPPLKLNGFCLSGIDAPVYDSKIAEPPGLFEELADKFHGYFDKFVPPRRSGYALDRLDAQIEKGGAISRYLMDTRPVDVFSVVFGSTDHVQHWFWQDRQVTGRDGRHVEDLLRYVYAKVDREIGEIVEECAGPDTVVMLVSDHGAGPCRGGFNIDLWLAGHGWLKLAGGGGGWRQGVRRAAVRFGGRVLPRAVQDRFRTRLSRARRDLISSFLTGRVDWAGTRAFCTSDYGNISLNLAGRFPAGAVPQAQRDELRDEIAEALTQVVDPETGERVMSAPLRAEDIYQGGRTETAPDLLAVTRGYRYEILTNFVLSGPLPAAFERTVFTPPHRQGLHRQEGIFSASGPGIKAGYQVGGLHIEDVAPTVLHLLGQPVPDYMDGRVATQIIDPEVLGRRPPRRREVETDDRGGQGRYSEDEEAEVKRTLRGLGYI